MLDVQLYRYNAERDAKPYMQSMQAPDEFRQRMVLDVLEYLRETDPSLAYRRSCREGVCGSDGMNIGGKNRLACITAVSDALDGAGRLIIRPLPGSTEHRAPAIARRACPARWPVRMHPLRLLFLAVSVLVVEPGEIYRPGRVAAGLALHRRQSGYGSGRAPGGSGRSLQRVPLPQHRQLQLGLPQGAQSNGRHWSYSARTPATGNLMA